ncbi:peptidylprolyl isomerase [Halobacteriovorax sp.]|uniref:FKBP-type peptidyl-prolyl cis-trans isomerase n=1 Tax=Halobacteriovorax sp. TaxID=2020862 RepID=UPI0035624947
MKIVDNSVVEIHYKLTNSSNEQIDSTYERSPLSFIQGNDEVPEKLENELYGKEIEDSFNIEIENAYGKIQEKYISSVPREQFGEEASKLKVGMQFHVEADGEEIIARIVELSKNEAILNGNHPLAGQTLFFEVLVANVRKATDEEVEQGFVAQERKSCACC